MCRLCDEGFETVDPREGGRIVLTNEDIQEASKMPNLAMERSWDDRIEAALTAWGFPATPVKMEQEKLDQVVSWAEYNTSNHCSCGHVIDEHKEGRIGEDWPCLAKNCYCSGWSGASFEEFKEIKAEEARMERVREAQRSDELIKKYQYGLASLRESIGVLLQKIEERRNWLEAATE